MIFEVVQVFEASAAFVAVYVLLLGVPHFADQSVCVRVCVWVCVSFVRAYEALLRPGFH